jgi:hypothetical protein
MTRSKSKHTKELKREGFFKLVGLLAGDETFCDILQLGDENQDDILDDIIRVKAQSTGYFLNLSSQSQSSARLLTVLKTQFGQWEHLLTSQSAIQLQKLLSQHTKRRRNRRYHRAKRVGLLSDADLPVYRLKRHSAGSEYPPPKNFILECHSPDQKKPPPPKKRDSTCGYCKDFHILQPDQLSFTLPSDQSAWFVDDETGETVAIVLWNLADDYVTQIQEWGVNIIKDSIQRRTLSQRNGPGKLARVGVSEGSRSRRMFNWVRNLRNKKGIDEDQHEYAISSLFGLFYSLLHAKAPGIASDFEAVMEKSGMPSLDKTNSNSYTLPLIHAPVAFYGYPLAPPEGYIGVDFVKQIHKDGHWDGCPWAAYWNLVRTQQDGKVGSESGASFFISDYGLRIINASNTCVIWNVSMWHGTGWYYNNVSHVGISLLLSKATESAWKEYQEKVTRGENLNEDLLWFLDEEDE